MKISVITINYNNATGLQKTIESVLSQTNTQYEFIVIDGGSTDGSIPIIQDKADQIQYWISEKDRGIYHAMNKGIDAAKGEYCIFMNSGDTFYNTHVLTKIAAVTSSADVLFGDCISFYKNIPVAVMAPKKISAEYFIHETLNHQSCFIRTKVLRDFGGYDEKIGLLADQDFFLKLAKAGGIYKYVSQKICVYDPSGISSNHASFLKHRMHMLETHFTSAEITAGSNIKIKPVNLLLFYVTYAVAIAARKLNANSSIKAIKQQA